MKYEVPFMAIDQQVNQLVQDGMEGDPEVIASRLSSVSYHRLGGYWSPFRQPDGRFVAGTVFENVWRHYVFDRQLRVLVMDALERFEVSFRTQLAYHHVQAHGPFAYATDRTSRPKMSHKNFPDFYFKFLEEVKRSKEGFIREFYEEYGDEHDVPPIWEATEVMSFGCVVTLYKSTTHKVKQAVASVFGVPDTVMESWLLTLNTVRNICAHHGRLWNRGLGTKPLIPRGPDYQEWHRPVEVGNERIFAVLTICQSCLSRIASQSRWAHRLENLLNAYQDISPISMGFPANWQECPLWQRRA